MRRRLGLQILFDFSDITEAILFASRRDARVLELNLGNIGFSEQLASSRERRRIRKAAADNHVTLALHAVEGPSFFVPSNRVRRCAIDELKRVLRQAEAVDARNVVMHLGFDMHYGANGSNRYTHEEFPDYYEQALGESLAELKAFARGRCRLCVENVGGFRYEPAREALDRLLGSGLGLCLDVGHVNVLTPDKRRVEMAFFRRHRRQIFHSHIHDNSGVRDEHRALGEGRIDFLPYFRLLATTSALLVFEVRPRAEAMRCFDYFDREIAPRLSRKSG